MINKNIEQYRQQGILSEVAVASPYRLIQMLYEGALERIAVARGAMQAGNIAKKGEQIGKAIDIVESLRAALDHDIGGELSGQLDALYEYMAFRLLQANLHNEIEALDEVTRLLREIKAGWDAIPPEEQNPQLPVR
ncbi:flagellar export chaperone FliS [Thiospirillum jenense]|uniref:Flagellar secretion chaperone FliS n=1 Tax=Thiospirillum jenense TaxID=1653858 RepID=A0A839HHY8_9GAMM|nr:flagellar export chaperone FliS [Thiospirillum jenense]MBB1126598.1 flagellar export chaperone FliS [Thiospirillum jenense]